MIKDMEQKRRQYPSYSLLSIASTMLPVDHRIVTHLQMAKEKGRHEQRTYNRVVYAAAKKRIYRIPVSATFEGKGKNKKINIEVHHEAASAHPYVSKDSKVDLNRTLSVSPQTLRTISNLVERNAASINWMMDNARQWNRRQKS